jgi:hypothetical protein
MMKPWQTPLNKAPKKRGRKKGKKERGPESESEGQHLE